MKSWSSLLSPASATNAACLRASAANVAVRTSGTQTCSGRRPRSRILRRYSPTLSLTVTPEMLHVTARKGTVAAVPAPPPFPLLLPLQVHDDSQCRVDATHLVKAEVPDAFA